METGGFEGGSGSMRDLMSFTGGSLVSGCSAPTGQPQNPQNFDSEGSTL